MVGIYTKSDHTSQTVNKSVYM